MKSDVMPQNSLRRPFSLQKWPFMARNSLWNQQHPADCLPILLKLRPACPVVILNPAP
jgi:hypothetical protein